MLLCYCETCSNKVPRIMDCRGLKVPNNIDCSQLLKALWRNTGYCYSRRKIVKIKITCQLFCKIAFRVIVVQPFQAFSFSSIIQKSWNQSETAKCYLTQEEKLFLTTVKLVICIFSTKKVEKKKKSQEIVLHAVAMRHWSSWTWGGELEVGPEARTRMAMSSIDGGIRNSSPNDELKTQFMTR